MYNVYVLHTYGQNNWIDPRRVRLVKTAGIACLWLRTRESRMWTPGRPSSRMDCHPNQAAAADSLFASVVATLQWAAKNGKVEVITKLVQHGADVNTSNRDGRISLHQAALMGHTRAVTRLVEMGSDMDRADRAGYTPLHQAAYMGHAEVVTEMSDMGCNVFVRDKSGATPLHWGAARGHLAVRSRPPRHPAPTAESALASTMRVWRGTDGSLRFRDARVLCGTRSLGGHVLPLLGRWLLG